jgi:VanZ family protein
MKKIQYLYFKFKAFFITTFLVSLAVIEYLAITPSPDNHLALGWDKLNHFFAFLVLYILLSLSFINMKMKIKVVFLLIFALHIEVIQYFTPSRSSSFADIVADIIGIFAGVFIYKYFFLRKTSLGTVFS